MMDKYDYFETYWKIVINAPTQCHVISKHVIRQLTEERLKVCMFRKQYRTRSKSLDIKN